MLLGNLIKSVRHNYKKIPVKGISFDSRKVKKGDIFFAIKGNKTSGINFIYQAIEKGASVIVKNKSEKYKKLKTPLVEVNNVRKSLSEACSKFYKEKPKNIIAVTGTNGKSSVVDFFYQLLRGNKIPVASIGTLGINFKNYKKKTNLTSIDSLALHKNLQLIKRRKINNVILEASSHGLDQNRLDYLKIYIGIFTNLSHDHLDYHKNMKSYFNSKMYLFNTLLNKNSKIITDNENKEFKSIKKISNKKQIKSYTIGTKIGNIKILDNKYEDVKQFVKILIGSKEEILEIPLIGYFQVKNLMMAVLAALCCGIKKEKIFNQIKKIKSAPGRLELIQNLKNNSNIIIDFAHTPEALETSLIALKKQFKKNITIVFGCGGERDKKKRLMMGKIAKKYCNKIIITDDNPRNENPKKIRKAIMKGCGNLGIDIGDRNKAIEMGIKNLEPNEILLIAGKGHEENQDYGNKIKKFSDKTIVKKIIKQNKVFLKKKLFTNSILKETFNKKKIGYSNFNGVSINSKTTKKNNLFFAVRGKRNDGHNFVKNALSRGACKVIVSKKVKNVPKNKLIKVKNTFFSLNKLANIIREKSSANIIGITGSVGKTTLKNLVSFALKNYGSTHHSPHSYNNKFGVPLSIANLNNNINYGVFEIGMDKKGEIYNLSKIVKPQIAVITNIGEAHLKNFKSINDIANAKAEIINNISKNGSIVLNKDDKFFEFLKKRAKKFGINIVAFSIRKKSDVFLLGLKKIKHQYKLKIKVKNKIFYFNTKNINTNFISSLLACVSVLYILNLDLKILSKKFMKFTFPEGRGDIKIIRKFNKKFKLIDESYNANPLSMNSAINNLNKFSRKNNNRKLIFLGDMLELGKNSKKFHKNLSFIINRSDIDKVFVYGKHIKETYNSLTSNKKGKMFNSLNEAYNHFSKILHNNDLLMVKGSNATGLNKFSKNIKKGQINAI